MVDYTVCRKCLKYVVPDKAYWFILRKGTVVQFECYKCLGPYKKAKHGKRESICEDERCPDCFDWTTPV